MSDGSMFAGDHGPDNAWRTEKGSMLAPHTQMPDLQDQNMGPDRLNQTVDGGYSWTDFLKPNEPLTHGGGTMAK